MSKYLLPTIIALIAECLTIPAGAYSQDAAKIVDQYIKAEGGSKILSKVDTLRLEGTFANAANEKPGTYTLITKLSNRPCPGAR
jgi:flagellar biosynthesis GTPase FlhF